MDCGNYSLNYESTKISKEKPKAYVIDADKRSLERQPTGRRHSDNARIDFSERNSAHLSTEQEARYRIRVTKCFVDVLMKMTSRSYYDPAKPSAFPNSQKLPAEKARPAISERGWKSKMHIH